MSSQSKLYVITGSFSSGKTRVVKRLAEMDYRTTPDAARVLIDEGMALGKTVAEIRKDEKEFQRRVLRLKMKIESELPVDEPVFLDRGVPCSVAYYALCGLDPQEARDVCRRGFYRVIFIMEPLPFKKDYARTETPEVIPYLHRSLREEYEQLGYEVIAVPVPPADLSKEEGVEWRVRFILDRI